MVDDDIIFFVRFVIPKTKKAPLRRDAFSLLTQN